VRVNLPAVCDPQLRLTQHRLGIRSRIEADKMTYDAAVKGLSRSIVEEPFHPPSQMVRAAAVVLLGRVGMRTKSASRLLSH
jgi:hypothetical protein